jgi:peptidoglycan biosynthesis protein MviN/MurJ (putative lipid II flippase)
VRGEIAKFLILAGVILVLAGIAVMLAPKIPWIGRLPGDIDVKGKNFRIYFPIVTCIILSILLTILLNLINIFRR